MADPKTKPDPTGLAGLIQELRAANDPASDLLIEHLHSARVNYLGGMTEEYRLSLQLADAAAHSLSDESLRSRLKTRLQKLQSDRDSAQSDTKRLDALVDEASEESFPASDPPAY